MMDLLIAAMATWQIVEIWHHSSLASSWRSTAEMWSGRLGELLACPFCFSVWVAAACVFVQQYPVSGLLVTAMAASRLANLGNDFFYFCNRTPKFNLPKESLEESE